MNHLKQAVGDSIVTFEELKDGLSQLEFNIETRRHLRHVLEFYDVFFATNKTPKLSALDYSVRKGDDSTITDINSAEQTIDKNKKRLESSEFKKTFALRSEYKPGPELLRTSPEYEIRFLRNHLITHMHAIGLADITPSKDRLDLDVEDEKSIQIFLEKLKIEDYDWADQHIESKKNLLNTEGRRLETYLFQLTHQAYDVYTQGYRNMPERFWKSPSTIEREK